MGKAPGLWLEGKKTNRGQADDWTTEAQSEPSQREEERVSIAPFTSTRIDGVQFNTHHPPLKCTRQTYLFIMYTHFNRLIIRTRAPLV